MTKLLESLNSIEFIVNAECEKSRVLYLSFLVNILKW